MEQYSQYLMWMKRKHHHILNSWEEQAFAEDTYGWPPRSYACSFCKKEFRSAQALGGHMNVHRRDRARLNDQSQVCPQTQVTATHLPSYKICDSNSSNPRQNFTSKQTQENEIVRLVHNTIENSKTVACKNISKRREEYSRFFQGHTDDDSVETSLCVGLSFAVSRSRGAAGDINGDSYKRQKTEDVFALPVWFKGCSNDNEKGNIDLELRLGDSPIVN